MLYLVVTLKLFELIKFSFVYNKTMLTLKIIPILYNVKINTSMTDILVSQSGKSKYGLIFSLLESGVKVFDIMFSG
jgi:hypothetical protein